MGSAASRLADKKMKIDLQKLSLIARQEFLGGVRSRWFLFSVLGMPLLMALLGGFALKLAKWNAKDPMNLIIVDESGAVFQPVKSYLLVKDGGLPEKTEIESAKINRLAPAETILGQLQQRVLNKDVDGYIHIPKDFLETGEAHFFALNVSNFELNARIQGALSAALQEQRMKKEGVEREKMQRIMGAARLDTFRVNPEGAVRDRFQTFGLVYALVLLLYFSVVVYGVTICRSIVEEKNSRIVEVMLSAARPLELLGGKVLGIGLLGIVQATFWSALALLILNYRSDQPGLFGVDSALRMALPAFSPTLAFFFVLWFVLGYFLFALLYAMAGAISTTDHESQQLQFPITILLIIPLVSQVGVISQPDSSLAIFLSLVPFFAPIAMFMRIAVLMPPWHQIALSVGISLLTIFALLWLVSRIYRVGILSYGKRPSLRQISTWFLQPD